MLKQQDKTKTIFFSPLSCPAIAGSRLGGD
jgi:hypothetical protein